MKNQYNKTITACFVGYIVQAIVNNFTPLLFMFFQKCYHIPISPITLLVTFNFGIQLLVDFLSVRFVDKIGYRISMIIAHVLAAAGFIPSYSFTRDFTSFLYWNFDCCNDLCGRWWTFGSHSQSSC